MESSTSMAKNIVGIGELLWDLLASGPRLGGTVSNFSVMAARLGNHAVIASRLGDDQLGRDAIAGLSHLPADTGYIQTDPSAPTGTVTVELSAGGQPSYVIHEPVAWDFLECTPQWLQLAAEADAVCFGTLAQRDDASRMAIRDFIDATPDGCVRVFDVNLRKPFYSAELIRWSLERATLLKLNDEELPVVLGLLGIEAAADGGEEAAELAGARALLKAFPLNLVCITLGSRGSLLVTREDHHRHPGIRIQVKDTVGAGDAFTAAMTHYYLQGASLAVLNEAGNRWGGWVASQPGAMPALDAETKATITNEIESVAALPRV